MNIQNIIEQQHLFTNGMYARTMKVPHGMLVVGHKHKNSVFNIVTKGTFIIYRIDTGETTQVSAPSIFITEPGSQKVLVSVGESELINIFRTDKTTIEEAEKDCVIPSEVDGLLPYERIKLCLQ